MRILLINPPIRENQEPYFHPIGLAIIAQMLLNKGHDVQMFDINCLRYDRDAVGNNLPNPAGGVDLIGVGGLISTYDYLNFLFPLLRANYPNVPIVLGGGGITSSPEVFMENLRPDFGVIGEGEYTMCELVDHLAGDSQYDDVLGLAYYEKDTLQVNSKRPLEKQLDNFPIQAFQLMDMETYVSNVRHNKRVTREAAILATRGCPFACTYCYHIFGQGFRTRSVGNILTEMCLLMEKYQVESFMFNDECFTTRKAFVHEFCNELIGRGIQVEWSTFSRVDTVDEETMKLMKEAGCIRLGFGFESGSEKILKSMNKRVTVQQMRDTYLMAKKYFPQVTGTMIFGMPEEDDDTILETVSFCKSINYYHPSFFLNPYPATKVYKDNLDKILGKYGTEHNYFRCLGDAKEFAVNLTRYSDAEYVEKKDMMDNEIYSYVQKKSRLSLAKRLSYNIQQLGIRGTIKKVLSKIWRVVCSR